MPTLLKIQGGKPLHGTIAMSGAKNAALPLIASCLLTEQTLSLDNVPYLSDIDTLIDLLKSLGVEVSLNKGSLSLSAEQIHSFTAPYELVSKMRASVLVLGPLVARFGHARVSLPGGCAIGVRPIDIHLDGLKALGCEVQMDHGYVDVKAPKGLKGTTFTMLT